MPGANIKNRQVLNVIWTDECSVQLDNHGHLCFKREEKTQVEALAEAPTEATRLGRYINLRCNSNSNLHRYLNSYKILWNLSERSSSVIEDVFPAGHCFQIWAMIQSIAANTWIIFWLKKVNWWKTPAESPDLNPIENTWTSLKYYLQHSYKPHNLETLDAGIRAFWKTVTPDVCRKYIGHIQKVMPKVVEVPMWNRCANFAKNLTNFPKGFVSICTCWNVC